MHGQRRGFSGQSNALIESGLEIKYRENVVRCSGVSRDTIYRQEAQGAAYQLLACEFGTCSRTQSNVAQ